MNYLQHLLNKINVVTSKHRHGRQINKEDLDSLSNAQIEYEENGRNSSQKEWYPLKDILSTLEQMEKDGWLWAFNTPCKYIILNMDMRDKACLIKNREGEEISLEDLKFQHTRLKDRGKQ